MPQRLVNDLAKVNSLNQSRSMSSTSIQKGRALERAVKFIEEAILKSSPKLAGAQFSFETNKTVTLSGVKHEVDVLVKTLPGSGYESTWIFECKNWDKPVGKNEVIVLAEKVKVLAAARGFLVAKRLSRSAAAQLKLDARLEYLACTDEFTSPLNSLQLVHDSHEFFSCKLGFKIHGVPPTAHPKAVDWEQQICRLNGREVDFKIFVMDQADRLALEDRRENAAQYRYEGKHFRKRHRLLEFSPRELMIGELDVEKMSLEVEFIVHVVRQPLFCKFELKGKGRVFTFESIENAHPAKSVQIDLVQLLER